MNPKPSDSYREEPDKTCFWCKHAKCRGDDVLCSLWVNDIGMYQQVESNGKCDLWEMYEYDGRD